jgi:hypothetical protein
MRLLALSRSVRPLGHQPSRYKIMTEALPRFKGRAAKRRAVERGATEITSASVQVPTPEDSGGTVAITSQRKVTQAPAKAGWAIGMVRIFKKIFFGKDPKMKAVEAGPCLAPRQTFDVPPQAYPRGRWTVFRNPFVKRGKSVEPTPPVQGELLLDLVKPVRNDLSDSDLEVVPATEPLVRQTVTDAESPLPSPSSVIPTRIDLKPELAAADWARVRDQFTGLEKF